MATTYTTLFKALLRKKPIERTAITSTRLDRCLSTLDLTTLGNTYLFIKLENYAFYAKLLCFMLKNYVL